MSEQKTSLEQLPVLRDDPLFWGSESFEPSLDSFNHEAYARAILKILTENKPPLSIGLFGPWGIGKSTIISILFKLITQDNRKKLKPLYFNAWKYSGDSFRRQFLIEVAKQVYEGASERDAKIRRLEQLNYTEVVREDVQKEMWEKLKDAFNVKIRFRESGLARVLLGVAILLVGVGSSYIGGSILPLLPGLFGALVLFFLRMKFEEVFVIQENPVYDPRLIFPEQFETEFRKLVDPAGPLGAATPVVVVDDIDRCEAGTIRDILVSIKTFMGQESCFFIVPCDDRSIVQVFQDPNQRSGYQDELLRKYFNVGVRIAPLMATDLVDFANSVSKKTEMPASVVQIAILANYRDARKMKHFLNTFAVKYSIAKARQESGYMPVDIDQNLPGFAKAVLIEDLYPDLFGRMVEHPEIYEILERAALGGGVDTELEKWGLKAWMTTYPGLRGIIEKTRDIKIEHVDIFLSLKTTNPEARIPRGFELKNSVVQGDEAAVAEILKAVSTEQARTALTELLIDLLDKTTDTFLKNTISASLNCYFNENLLTTTDKPRIAKEISRALAYKEGTKVLQQRAISVLQCAKDAGGDFLTDLVEKYKKELGELDQPSEGMEDTINALYALSSQPGPLSALLNKKFEPWIGTEKGLSILTKLQLPKDLRKEDAMPSAVVLEKVTATLSPENTAAALTSNNLRKQVLFKNWDKQIAPILADRLLLMFGSGSTDSGYTQRLAFVIQTLTENHECLEAKYSVQLWPHVQQLFGRVTDANVKFDVHRAVLVFAAECPVGGPKQEARTFAVQNWQGFTDEQLRQTISYLASFRETVRDDLQKTLLQQELSTAQSELQNPTARTKQRVALCFENKSLLAPKSIDSLLLKALETPDSAFNVWRVTVSEYSKQLESDFPQQIAEQCLSLVSGSYSQPRRQGFLELFLTVLPILEEAAKPRLLQNYFVLCRHGDTNVRTPAAIMLGSVRKAVNEQDFKLGLNALVREICRMTPAEVAGYRPTLDALLEHSALFGDYEWRDLADLSKRCIQQPDASVQDYGLLLIERMPSIHSDHQVDLIHLLVGIARGTNAALKERADKRLRQIPETDLSTASRQTLQEYLAPVQGEGEKPGA